MKSKALLLLGLFLFQYSYCCINIVTVDKMGRRHTYENNSPTNIRNDFNGALHSLKYLEEQMKEITSERLPNYQSDYAARLLQVGRTKEALDILERLAQRYPNNYSILANLAVAYELSGELEKALYYLDCSLEIEPHSHKATEWFHKKILETALIIKHTNKSPYNIRIFSFPEEREIAVAYAIGYQLQERMPLTPAKNDLLSKVLIESGDYFLQHISLVWGMELYAFAIAYTQEESIKANLWKKLEEAQVLLVTYNKKSKITIGKEYLYSNWKPKITKLINQWKNYTPQKYEGPIMTIAI